MKSQKNIQVDTQISRYFVIQIRATLKMQQKIKLTCPSRQLFIKITFAFMKIFDFLVKIAIFGAFLFRSRDSRHVLLPEKEKCSKYGYFDEKIKNFHKSKSDFYDKLSTWASWFYDLMHNKQWHFFKRDLLKRTSLKNIFFLHFSICFTILYNIYKND